MPFLGIVLLQGQHAAAAEPPSRWADAHREALGMRSGERGPAIENRCPSPN